MKPADNKPAHLTIQLPAETEVGPHVNPNRHVPMVPADHHSVNDDEFLVAHGLVLNALTLYYARHRRMGRVRTPKMPLAASQHLNDYPRVKIPINTHFIPVSFTLPGRGVYPQRGVCKNMDVHTPCGVRTIVLD